MQTSGHVAKLGFFQVSQKVANRADEAWKSDPSFGTRLALQKSFWNWTPATRTKTVWLERDNLVVSLHQASACKMIRSFW